MRTPAIVRKASSVCLLLIVAGVLLTGCGLFGKASDGSELNIKSDRECTVDLAQHARASGLDDADVVETIRVDDNCIVEVDFRQTVGNSVMQIENPELEYSKDSGPPAVAPAGLGDPVDPAAPAGGPDPLPEPVEGDAGDGT